MTLFNYSLENNNNQTDLLEKEDLSQIEEAIAIETERQISLLSVVDSETLAFENFVNTLSSVQGTKVINSNISAESIAFELNKFMPENFSISAESIRIERDGIEISLEEVDKTYVKRTFGIMQSAFANLFKSWVDQFQYTFTWFDQNEKRLNSVIEGLKGSSFNKVTVKVTDNKYMYSGKNYYNGKWSEYRTSMKEYFSETSEVRTELRKYIDKNMFSGLKTLFNIATLNEDNYIDNAQSYLSLINKFQSDLKMKTVPGHNHREIDYLVSDMYLGMSRYYTRSFNDIKQKLNSRDISEIHRQVRGAEFNMDRYKKFEVSILKGKRELNDVDRKELIALLEEARKTIASYKEYVKFTTMFSSYMKMSSIGLSFTAPIPSIILMLLSKNYLLYKKMSFSCLYTIAGTVNHTRGNIKNLLDISEEVLKKGQKL